jgi:hypothetical protein
MLKNNFGEHKMKKLIMAIVFIAGTASVTTAFAKECNVLKEAAQAAEETSQQVCEVHRDGVVTC